MIDFNDAPIFEESHPDSTRDEVKAELLARLESLLPMLFPAGKLRHGKFTIGNLDGTPGDSLEIRHYRKPLLASRKRYMELGFH